MEQPILVQQDQAGLELSVKKGDTLKQLNGPKGETFLEVLRAKQPEAGIPPLAPGWESAEYISSVDQEIILQPGERKFTQDPDGVIYLGLPRS